MNGGEGEKDIVIGAVAENDTLPSEQAAMSYGPSTEIFDLLSRPTRWERYRLAEKTLRFHVYQWMETYVMISFVAGLALPWLADSLVRALIHANTWVVAVVGIAHHAKLVTRKPWLLIAAAFEATVVWAIYEFLVIRVLELPYFGTYCVFLFVLRYWMRGEREVNARAHERQLSGA